MCIRLNGDRWEVGNHVHYEMVGLRQMGTGGVANAAKVDWRVGFYYG